MLPTLKVYNIDYEFIVSNYLDKSLWNKTWNLFIYKDNIFTINLYRINVKDMQIIFEIKMNKLQWNQEFVSYPLSGEVTIEMLKNKISSKIQDLIMSYEYNLITDSYGYKAIKNSMNAENDFLTRVAEDFLDDNGVTNAEIREVYIDNYVTNHSTISDKLSGYVQSSKYQYATDLILVYSKATKREHIEKAVLDSLKNYDVSAVLEEVEKYTNRMDEEDEELYQEFYDLAEAI